MVVGDMVAEVGKVVTIGGDDKKYNLRSFG